MPNINARDQVDELVPDPQAAKELNISLMTVWRWDRDPELAAPAGHLRSISASANIVAASCSKNSKVPHCAAPLGRGGRSGLCTKL